MPAVRPVTFPNASTVAIAASATLQVPPATGLLNANVVPAQKVPPPVVTPNDGGVMTLNGNIVSQPEGMMYVIVVFPDAIPVTTPPAEMEAIAGLLLIHEPPDRLLDKVTLEPIHTESVPVIAGGVWFMVSRVVSLAKQVPRVAVNVYTPVADVVGEVSVGF